MFWNAPPILPRGRGVFFRPLSRRIQWDLNSLSRIDCRQQTWQHIKVLLKVLQFKNSVPNYAAWLRATLSPLLISRMMDDQSTHTATDAESTFSRSLIDADDHDDPQTDATSVTSADSGFWEVESSTHSVNSSIFDYEKSHGRTYHAYHQGQYLLPNDADEIERIEVKYHAIRLALQDNLFFAPVDSPRNILDVGTGTGTWCVETADEYPNAIVKGIDLSPIQPTYVPPNCFFQVADADDDWTFSTDFDLIHTRIMNDFTLRSWPRFFEQAYAHLAPGGWIECQEFDYHRRSDDASIPPHSRLSFWESEWTRGIRRIGLSGGCNPRLVMRQMRAAGFTSVHTRYFKMPIGPWPKDPALKQCGLFGLVNLIDGIHGLSVKIFTELLDYSTAELEVLLMECRKEVTQKKVHSYYPVYVIMGQKPPLPSPASASSSG